MSDPAPLLANLIGGEWCASDHKHEFELELDARAFDGQDSRTADAPSASHAPRERLRVARASGADAERALAHLRSGAARVELEALERAARVLASRPDPSERLARRLHMSRSEVDALHARLAERIDAALHRHAPRAEESAGAHGEPIALVRLDATELASGLAAEVFGLLARGWRVAVLSDPHAPMIAASVVEALLEGGVDRRAVALLHDDGDTLVRSALDALAGTAHAVRASAPTARARALERLLADAASRASRAPFDREVRALANHSRCVRADADVEAEARAIAHAAFGRVPALGGQAPGVPGRVLCHERVFSRFSAALLAELARGEDLQRPLRALDPALREHVAHAFELGLDEGATAIFTPAELGARAARENELAPLVFTNVEEHMRIAWLGRPAPILCLVRVASDARALELAAELDRDPLAEDLSHSGGAPELLATPA